jgi:two-component sensor histidine kinase
MGLKKESLKWAKECLEGTIRIENYFPYLVFREIATDMIKDGQAAQVLKRLEKAEIQFPPDQSKLMFISFIKGDCYAALNKPAVAESYYLQGIDVLEKRSMRDSYYYLGNKSIAEFYVDQKQYSKASPYLQKVFDTKHPLFSVTDLATAHQLQFKIDSAKGDYLSAIKHFETAKAMTDSIFNQVRLKQSEQLQVQFETAQRDHENLVLRNKNNLQKSELEKAGLNRKLISIALIGSVLVIGLMLYLYRAKQKSNKMLRLRQGEINTQNTQLNQLLQEKEWLMKEIHHRVKNNLQIISSLLNTQSSYLDNEQALMAIRDSQNRMQAISIVHQKLYQSDDLSTIDVRRYIEELARNIQGSFHTQGRIEFVFEIENIRLTSADTVPLGLILNEAITNSVKYAFKGKNRGVITISMSKISGGQYRLEVRDNGKGLPVGFDVENCTSLGVNLMTGLTEQLNGKFEIWSENGTGVSVVFKPSLPELIS